MLRVAATATFAVGLQLGFTATKCRGLRVRLRLQAQICHRCVTAHPYRLRNRALIGVYRRLLLHAGMLCRRRASPRVRHMGSRRAAEGCVDANTQCARLQASGKTLGSQKKAPGPQRCSSQPVLLFVADCLKLAISHPQRCGRVTAITAPSQGPQGHLRGTPPPPRRTRNDALPVLRPQPERRHHNIKRL